MGENKDAVTYVVYSGNIKNPGNTLETGINLQGGLSADPSHSEVKEYQPLVNMLFMESIRQL